MDAQTILRIRPSLTQYLTQFDDCFGRVNSRRHLDTYIEGQLSDLERKSVEPIADAAGTPPRTLQEFLSLFRWDESAMRDRLQRRIARRHGHVHAVGIIDETSFVKKGEKTACVQRQHCGAVGKMENCVVSVHLGYAAPNFHTMLDGDLFLPEQTWERNRQRCRAAGIPDNVTYRPKWQIALEQLRRALANGVRFRWLTFDEGYGGKPPFLRELASLGQNYVAEVPVTFHAWTNPPQVLYRDHSREKKPGRPRRIPRLKAKNNPTADVRNILKYSPVMRREPWEKYWVKDGSKGPMIFEAKRIIAWLKDEDGLPTAPHHLMVTRPESDPSDVKYFISNAPAETTIETLLLVVFSRWRIERMFEGSKGELGMDHFEVRRYLSIQRHLILSCVSHLFMAEFHQEHRGGGSGLDDMSGPNRHVAIGTDLGTRRPVFTQTGRDDQCAIGGNAGNKLPSRSESPQDDDPQITRKRHHVDGSEEVCLATVVAL